MHGNKEACEQRRHFQRGKPSVPAVRRVLKEEFAIKVTRRGNVVVEEHLGRGKRGCEILLVRESARPLTSDASGI